uniref:Uncharacterized protein n=1 Tax=Zea mays TaxID=4577 RepID=A0A804PZS6_MAIZE
MGEHRRPPWASPPSAPSSSAPRPPPAPATAAGRPGPRSRTSGVLYNINTEESRIGLYNGNSLPLLQRIRSKASFSSDANLLDLYSLLSGVGTTGELTTFTGCKKTENKNTRELE